MMLRRKNGEVGDAVVGLRLLELALIICMRRTKSDVLSTTWFPSALLLLLLQRMLLSFCSALIVGMRRSFVQRAPFERPFFPGLLPVGVVLGTMPLAVSKRPADVALRTVEIVLCLHGDTAPCNRGCA